MKQKVADEQHRDNGNTGTQEKQSRDTFFQRLSFLHCTPLSLCKGSPSAGLCRGRELRIEI